MQRMHACMHGFTIRWVRGCCDHTVMFLVLDSPCFSADYGLTTLGRSWLFTIYKDSQLPPGAFTAAKAQAASLSRGASVADVRIGLAFIDDFDFVSQGKGGRITKHRQDKECASQFIHSITNDLSTRSSHATRDSKLSHITLTARSSFMARVVSQESLLGNSHELTNPITS